MKTSLASHFFQVLRPTIEISHAFFQSLGIEPIAVSGEQQLAAFKQIKFHIDTTISQFESVSIPELGFLPFSESDLVSVLSEDDVFGLEFHRVAGKGVLYGLSHVKLRRFINDFPVWFRVQLIQKKIKALQLDFMFPKGFLDSLEDVFDIGMGNAVYVLKGKTKSLVLKKGASEFQALFLDILDSLQFKSYASETHVQNNQEWSLSDYLGDQTLSVVVGNDALDIGKLVNELAIQAAIGDFFNRGDRHIENYVMSKNMVLPVDISDLFCRENDKWTYRYVCGGMYEINLLDTLFPKNLEEGLKLFFLEYKRMYTQLFESNTECFETLTMLQVKPVHLSQFDLQIQKGLAYMQTQMASYLKGFFESRKRKFIKSFLADCVALNGLEALIDTPLLRMSYLADLDRYSTLYLLEERVDSVMSELQVLNRQIGGDEQWDQFLRSFHGYMEEEMKVYSEVKRYLLA